MYIIDDKLLKWQWLQLRCTCHHINKKIQRFVLRTMTNFSNWFISEYVIGTAVFVCKSWYLSKSVKSLPLHIVRWLYMWQVHCSLSMCFSFLNVNWKYDSLQGFLFVCCHSLCWRLEGFIYWQQNALYAILPEAILFLNSSLSSVAFMHLWIGANLVPSYYQNQCWITEQTSVKF